MGPARAVRTGRITLELPTLTTGSRSASAKTFQRYPFVNSRLRRKLVHGPRRSTRQAGNPTNQAAGLTLLLHPKVLIRLADLSLAHCTPTMDARVEPGAYPCRPTSGLSNLPGYARARPISPRTVKWLASCGAWPWNIAKRLPLSTTASPPMSAHRQHGSTKNSLLRRLRLASASD